MDGFSDYRDDKGRFTAGNPGAKATGSGRPREEAVERVRGALLAVLDDETLQQWARAMRKKLSKGNLAATDLVLNRLMGKPAVTLNLAPDDTLAAFVMAWTRAGEVEAAEPPAQLTDESEA